MQAAMTSCIKDTFLFFFFFFFFFFGGGGGAGGFGGVGLMHGSVLPDVIIIANN